MKRARIDVHHHVLPPAYVEWLRGAGIHEAGGRELPRWSPDAALGVMEEHGIGKAIVSISTPGVRPTIGTTVEESRRRARECNEEVADLVRRQPARFGFFATLTLPDVDGAVAEATRSLDHSGASGVILIANTHGRYLGDPEDAPLFDPAAA